MVTTGWKQHDRLKRGTSGLVSLTGENNSAHPGHWIFFAAERLQLREIQMPIESHMHLKVPHLTRKVRSGLLAYLDSPLTQFETDPRIQASLRQLASGTHYLTVIRG